ncbi:endonuclease NucS domain-containing protein [Roseiconus lacunae]|uniref:endonuclease NucS domain-containing protein n=1 Tax=Roseiconus lacunae TaxID=2605694 RepID=UPI00309029B3|nr:endonuclease NucS domain-containing protein [Stieleria sp. HD01]
MKNYYRVMLGRKSVHSAVCIEGDFIGADYGIEEDLTGKVPDQWRDFNVEYIPVYLRNRPGKTRIAAGLACGALWVIAKGIENGDVLLCPDGTGKYRVGEVTGDYYYATGKVLPHRRPVKWLPTVIDRSAMSDALQSSAGSSGSVCNLTRAGHSDEISRLIGGQPNPVLVVTDPNIENPREFAMEKHLEDFLVRNWPYTELGQEYDIFEEEGELVGQQYETDTGPLDILAISKDHKKLLVVELKKGRASDHVVGQILRYMGFVKGELAEPDQTVEGIIIALTDDQRIRRALSMTPQIDFYRYEISFKLSKVQS